MKGGEASFIGLWRRLIGDGQTAAMVVVTTAAAIVAFTVGATFDVVMYILIAGITTALGRSFGRE